MEQMAKKSLRSAKNFTKGYSETQIKVREATSNDPWGASGALMAEISELSYTHKDFIEIMEMIDRRLNDHGKNWRHVFKALTLLDYLLRCGSENVLAYARDNLYVVRTLKEFQYVDEFGKDQGANVRQKSREVTELLADEARLKDERRARLDGRGKALSGALDDPLGRGGFGPDDDVLGRVSAAAQASGTAQRRPASSSSQAGGQEDADLQRALEESRRTAAEEDRRRRTYESSDHELQQAIRESQSELRRDASVASVGPPGPQAQQQLVDLRGGPANVDFFESLDSQAYAPPPQQQQQVVYQQRLMIEQHQQAPGADFFGRQSFVAPPQPLQQQPHDFFGSATALQQAPAFNPFDQAGHAHRLPAGFNGAAPNAQLADIARNSAAVDPFAAMAAQRVAQQQPLAIAAPPPSSTPAMGVLNGVPTGLVQIDSSSLGGSLNGSGGNPSASGIVFSKLPSGTNPFPTHNAGSAGAPARNPFGAPAAHSAEAPRSLNELKMASGPGPSASPAFYAGSSPAFSGASLNPGYSYAQPQAVSMASSVPSSSMPGAMPLAMHGAPPSMHGAPPPMNGMPQSYMQYSNGQQPFL